MGEIELKDLFENVPQPILISMNGYKNYYYCYNFFNDWFGKSSLFHFVMKIQK